MGYPVIRNNQINERIRFHRSGPKYGIGHTWRNDLIVSGRGSAIVEKGKVKDFSWMSKDHHLDLAGEVSFHSFIKLMKGQAIVDRARFMKDRIFAKKRLRNVIGTIYFPDRLIKSDFSPDKIVAIITSGFKPVIVHGGPRKEVESGQNWNQIIGDCRKELVEDLVKFKSYSNMLKGSKKKKIVYEFKGDVKGMCVRAWNWARSKQAIGELNKTKKFNLNPQAQRLCGQAEVEEVDDTDFVYNFYKGVAMETRIANGQNISWSMKGQGEFIRKRELVQRCPGIKKIVDWSPDR